MRAAKPLDGPITKPIEEVIIQFDETEFLPSDVVILYRDGSMQAVPSISTFPHAIFEGMTVFTASFGEKDAEFCVGITAANVVLEKISRRKGGASDV